MTQHSIKPYLVEDELKNPLWKIVDEKMVRNQVNTRISFRTNVSKSLLESLKGLASKNNTHVNHLIENGLKNLFLQTDINLNKIRVQYKTTYDKQMLDDLKVAARHLKVDMNDLIEHCLQFIELIEIKRSLKGK